MAKRKESGFDLVVALPWPMGVAFGFAAFVAIQYGIGWLWGSSTNPFLSGFAKIAASGMYSPLAWIALLACCAAATASFFKRRRRRQLLDSQTGVESLSAMDWRAFELLAGEAFRRQGYAVEETGQGGPDGGIDLVLRKSGRKTLVQCKQWRSWRVDVKVVREMYGLMIDQRADDVKIVALGRYTSEAERFARGKPIQLIDGQTLLSTVKAIQARKEPGGALDNPLVLAGGVLASLLIAYVFPSPQAARPAPSTVSPSSPMTEAHPQIVAPTNAPTTVTPQPHGTQPARKVYAAEPPMSNEELREWEKKNREAMKILEKTTPELETPPTH